MKSCSLGAPVSCSNRDMLAAFIKKFQTWLFEASRGEKISITMLSQISMFYLKYLFGYSTCDLTANNDVQIEGLNNFIQEDTIIRQTNQEPGLIVVYS
jgi:hypothetical protein